jgi:hypothetical protein
MKHLIEAVMIVLFFLALQLVSYCAFTVCLSDDIHFRYGKRHLRNKRRKEKPSVFTKIFYLDVRKEVVRWHYVDFWIHFLSGIPFIAITILYGVYEIRFLRTLWLILCAIWLGSLFVIFTVRWDLYGGNKSRKRDPRKYRR